ncbi:MAG: hypothetical protein IPM82_01800 [Saprospiraceae bacterium]|nr:hypothetical protein [Saprospiraceae bacterium]
MPKLSHFLRSLAIGATPLAVSIYCLLYWGASHQQLVAWYKNINPYFYKASTWETELFTVAVKRQAIGGAWRP